MNQSYTMNNKGAYRHNFCNKNCIFIVILKTKNHKIMKKVILGLSLLAFVASSSFAGDIDKGKCCSDKDKVAMKCDKSKAKCCADMEKEAKAEKKSDKKVAKKAA
jgi:hypothetical protein